MDIEYISPQRLLMMTADDYLRTYGNENISERSHSIMNTRLNKNADHLRQGIIGAKPKSHDGEPLVVWDLVRVHCSRLRKDRIGAATIQYISEALERNELRLNMSDKDIAQYIEKFDVTIAKLRSALEGVCQQCIKEHKRDFSRIFDKQKAIMPGFECYVMVTKV